MTQFLKEYGFILIIFSILAVVLIGFVAIIKISLTDSHSNYQYLVKLLDSRFWAGWTNNSLSEGEIKSVASQKFCATLPLETSCLIQSNVPACR